MALINGTLVVLRQGTTTLVGQTDASMNSAGDMLDSTTKDNTAKAKSFAPGETGWTMSVNGLYDPAAATEGSISNAIGILKAGTVWAVKYGQTTGSAKYFGGNAYISSVTLNGPKNDLASYTIELQGTGVLTEGTN